MEQEEFDEAIREISEILQGLLEKDEDVGFILVAGLEVQDPLEKDKSQIDFRVIGGGSRILLASMMLNASENDEDYKEIFDAVMQMKKTGRLTTANKVEKPIPFSLEPTIKKSDFK